MSGELRYLSRRLARDLIQRWEATPQEETTTDFQPVRAGSVHLPTDDNLYEEAEASEAIAAALGSLATVEEDPVAAGKSFVVVPNAAVRLWVFKATGEYHPPRTALVSVRQGERLLVLLGSPANVVGFAAEPQVSGWVPSEAAGLRNVIRQLKEDRGEEDLEALPWPETIETAADFAVNIGRPADFQGFARVLARVYAEEPDVRTYHRTSGGRAVSDFARVIVGAPVFIREA